MRRRKLLGITVEAMATLCKAFDEGLWLRVAKSEIPPDAVQCGAGYDFHRNAFYLIFEHPSFPEVRSGDTIPWADLPEWETWLDDEAAGDAVAVVAG